MSFHRLAGLALACGLLCAPLGACSTPGSPAAPATAAQTAQRAMLMAETAFNVAATAELNAKGTGVLAGDRAVRADAIRHQAYAALLALRATYAAGRSPDVASFLLLTNQLLMLAGKSPVDVSIPTIPTIQP